MKSKSTPPFMIIFSVMLLALCGSCTTMESTAKPNPELSSKYLVQGKELEAKGELLEALEQYTLALTVDPNNREAEEHKARTAAELSKLADERYQLGIKYYDQGKYGLARKEFLVALKYQPDHPKASKMLVSRQPEQAPEFTTHVVQKGETLSIIAKKYYGDFRKYTIIAQFNNIADAASVKPGQTLKIPDTPMAMGLTTVDMVDKQTVGFVWHTVQPGQSISKLAKIYYGDFKQFHIIARYNDMYDATQVKVGDKIKIPRVRGLAFYEPKKQKTEKPPPEPDPEEEVKPLPEPHTEEPLESVPKPGEEPSDIAMEPSEDSPPELSDLNGDQQVLAYRDTGIALYEKGNFDDAIFELDKAIEAMPDDAQTRAYLAKAYYESGKALFREDDFGAAKEAFESSLQYDPDCEGCYEYIERAEAGPYMALRAQGIDYLNRGEFTPAISQFEKYLQAIPGDEEARRLLSQAYYDKALVDYNKGEFMSAKAGFETALEYNRQCEKCSAYREQSLQSWLALHYKQGVAFYEQQQLAAAIDEWEKVYELDPKYEDVEQNLAKARKLKEKLDKIKKDTQP